MYTFEQLAPHHLSVMLFSLVCRVILTVSRVILPYAMQDLTALTSLIVLSQTLLLYILLSYRPVKYIIANLSPNGFECL